MQWIIRPGGSEDYSLLIAIWERAVRATHTFLPEEKIYYYRDVIPRLYFPQVELSVACEAGGPPLGFAGLTPPSKGAAGEAAPAKVDMLFVEPDLHGRGMGRMLLRSAWEAYGTLELNVNEQNPGAVIFYEKCGFVHTGRSERDGEGNPFPLLHMRRKL